MLKIKKVKTNGGDCDGELSPNYFKKIHRGIGDDSEDVPFAVKNADIFAFGLFVLFENPNDLGKTLRLSFQKKLGGNATKNLFWKIFAKLVELLEFIWMNPTQFKRTSSKISPIYI